MKNVNVVITKKKSKPKQIKIIKNHPSLKRYENKFENITNSWEIHFTCLRQVMKRVMLSII